MIAAQIEAARAAAAQAKAMVVAARAEAQAAWEAYERAKNAAYRADEPEQESAAWENAEYLLQVSHESDEAWWSCLAESAKAARAVVELMAAAAK